MNSIIQTNKVCWVCGVQYELHSHHILYGTANRKLSEKYGLKVWLCARHHNMSNNGVHSNKELDFKLKRLAQKKFEETHTRDDFIKTFGRNYL